MINQDRPNKSRISDSQKTSPGSKLNPFWDFWAPIFLTFGLYTLIRIFVEARYIPSGSMLPTLQIQDRLLIEKITYKHRKPLRGEIVVFNSPYSFNPILIPRKSAFFMQCTLTNLPVIAFIPGLSHPTCDAYIKRIVAIEGDVVNINSRGAVKVNGIDAKEPYVSNYCLSSEFQSSTCPTLSLTVPIGQVFVLGDNRRNSWDGRFWPGEPFLPIEEIIGRAVWRFWPISQFGKLNF